MAGTDSRVTIHMAASLDGLIARKDGSIDWLDTSDEFAGGDTMAPGFVEAFLKTIDCYVMNPLSSVVFFNGVWSASAGSRVASPVVSIALGLYLVARPSGVTLAGSGRRDRPPIQPVITVCGH